MAQFSVQWDAYKQSICNGLSTLQQNGEMVDVTLAADGHQVRVHRLVLSLASPYLKEMLASAADCKHPVVFLSRISYETLRCILEYMYTGQATVSREQLPDLVQAAKELRIKGLEDMDIEVKLEAVVPSSYKEQKTKKMKPQQPLELRPELDNTRESSAIVKESATNIPHERVSNRESRKSGTQSRSLPLLDEESSFAHESEPYTMDNTMETDTDQDSDWKCVKSTNSNSDWKCVTSTNSNDQSKRQKPNLDYTVSNQGGLQLVLNRYLYCLKYTSSKGEDEGHRRWRCSDYGKSKLNCRAIVVTINDVVAKRIGVHNHPFHDKRILKKVQQNLVYSTLEDAKSQACRKKAERSNQN